MKSFYERKLIAVADGRKLYLLNLHTYCSLITATFELCTATRAKPNIVWFLPCHAVLGRHTLLRVSKFRLEISLADLPKKKEIRIRGIDKPMR